MVSLKMEMSFGMDPLLEWKFEDAQNSHRVTANQRGATFTYVGIGFKICGGVQLWVGIFDLNFNFYCWGGDPKKPK